MFAITSCFKGPTLSTHKDLYDELIYVLVGPRGKVKGKDNEKAEAHAETETTKEEEQEAPGQERFGIHKGLLCHYSSYFTAALKGPFKEAQDGLVTLSDDDPKIFRYFRDWLYSQSLLNNGVSVQDAYTEDINEAGLDWQRLIDLYIFSDKRGIVKLKNMVVDVFYRKTDVDDYVPTEYINEIYENTTRSSPLRKLMADMCASEMKESGFRQSLKEDHLCYDFLVDVAAAMKSRMELNSSFCKSDMCIYHEHSGHSRCDDQGSDGEVCVVMRRSPMRRLSAKLRRLSRKLRRKKRSKFRY